MRYLTPVLLLAGFSTASPFPQAGNTAQFHSKSAVNPGYIDGCPQERENCTRVVVGNDGERPTMDWGDRKPSDVISEALLGHLCGPNGCEVGRDFDGVSASFVETRAGVDTKVTKNFKITVVKEDWHNAQIRDMLVQVLQGAFMIGAQNTPKPYLGSEGAPYLGRVAPPKSKWPTIDSWEAGTYFSVYHQAFTPEDEYYFELSVRVEQEQMTQNGCDDAALAGAAVGGIAGALAAAFPPLAPLGIIPAILGVTGPFCSLTRDSQTPAS